MQSPAEARVSCTVAVHELLLCQLPEKGCFCFLPTAYYCDLNSFRINEIQIAKLILYVYVCM